MSILGIVFLVIFAASLFVNYVAIRRRLLTIQAAGMVCVGLTVTSLIAFGLSEDLEVLHAIAVGLVAGLGFTGAMVAMAAFFLANQPDSALNAYLPKKDTSSK